MKMFNRHWFSTETIVLTLVLLTIALIAWQHWGMNHVFTIEKSDKFIAWAESDKKENGISEVSFSEDPHYRMNCKIISRKNYPFCHLFVRFSKDATMFDLSKYQDLFLTLDYRSDAQDSINVNLNYFYPKDDAPQPGVYYKPNQQSFNPSQGISTYHLELADFYVASWWIYWNNIPNGFMTPDLSRVQDLVIGTGENHDSREVDVALIKAEFVGKWIQAEVLYRYILLFWSCLIILYMVRKVYLLRINVNSEKAHLHQLKTFNEKLRYRSKKLEELIKKDDLTGTYNLEGFKDILAKSVKKKKTNGTPFSLLLVSPDYIHRVNNQYGTDQTEKLLKNLANILVSLCRTDDAIARWSHTDFLIVCNNTSLEAADKLAQRICAEVRNSTLVEGHNITCSIGVAELNDLSIANLLINVEKALQLAQSSGRNRSAKTI